MKQNHQIKKHLNIDTEESVDDPIESLWPFLPRSKHLGYHIQGLSFKYLFVASTPSSTPFTNEVAVMPTQPAPSSMPFSNESTILQPATSTTTALSEVSRADLDSVDGDQPDSGIDENDDSKQVRANSALTF